MENKGKSLFWSDIRNVFIREFPEFKHEFENLSSHEDFNEMLTDYGICQKELEKLSMLQSEKELYIQLKNELKEEILNFVLNHIKLFNKN